MELTDSIQYLRGVGPKMALNFNRLGIWVINDLIHHYPRKYLNLSQPQKISDFILDDLNCFRAKIVDLKLSRTSRQRVSILKATLEDESGQIDAIWFNQPFLVQTLCLGSTWIFYGKVERNFNRQINLVSPQFEKAAKIIAIYPETEGLSSKYLRMIIASTLSEIKISEFIPLEIINNEKLISIDAALKKIHRPTNLNDISQARLRLAFDEMLFLALKTQKNRLAKINQTSVSIPIDENGLKKFVQSIPFKLTDGQKKATWQIVKDVNKKVPMNRLLNGDVGSGKTIVAAIALYHIAAHGYQAALMAPTEILANQHLETIKKLSKPFNFSVSLRTGALKEDKKEKPLDYARGREEKDIIIGTHALIQEKVSIPRLALVVVDEQHRFGVQQRLLLRQKSKLEFEPHFLSMTATPIPRTLALSIYGDLDISVLDELPAGRQKIITKIVHPSKRGSAYQFIEKQINSGRQAFVICPLIEKNETKKTKLLDIEKKTVLDEFKKLNEDIFPHRKIGLLHGRLKSAEKEKVMKNFKDRKLDIIVSTSVIEVGVDVPNATVTMIEGAENFGLAQLWQFRGRVGRGKHQSYCFLFTEIWSAKIKERLKSVVLAKNGFELAEKDLAMRGPGELIGVSQSGLPDFKMASLSDFSLINRTKLAAQNLLAKSQDLSSFPQLRQMLQNFETSRHLE